MTVTMKLEKYIVLRVEMLGDDRALMFKIM